MIRAQYGASDITLVGFCSGAYHAMRAAIDALPISRAIMVNPETYFWSEDQSIYGRQTAELVRQPETYRNKLFSAQSWKRVFRGQINFRYVLGTFSGRFSLTLGSALRNIARRLHIPLPNDLGWQLEAAGSRGVRLLFVFSRGEPGFDLLKLQAGVSLKRLSKHCEIHLVDNADHVFSKRESRATLEIILSRELIVRASA